MGRIIEKDNLIDVICQHKKDGTIIPMKIRIQDEDGEYQNYMVKGYKDLTDYANYNVPSGMGVTNHIWRFDCKITILKQERVIRVIYNSMDNVWKIVGV